MKYFIYWILISHIFWSCANRAVPSGGPRDEIPPNVIWEKSTLNRKLEFEKEPITITFDEWVKLDDPLNQILVSPPLEQRPEILLKGKSVIITFDEDEMLREDATYTINFGEAIQDITESNVIKNFTFVFSTGSYIDSLVVEGIVFDAFSEEPIENATVMLYENMEDSVVFNEKPFYAAKTEKDGTFTIYNVKEGIFKVVAITDENLNYLYEPETEKIGYLPLALNTGDTISHNIRLTLSQQLPSLSMNRIDTSSFNHAILPFNREPYEISIAYDSIGQEVQYLSGANQIKIWHRASEEIYWDLYLNDTLVNEADTISMHSMPISNDVRLQHIQSISGPEFKGHPSSIYTICFDRPVQSIDSTFFLVKENDSIVPGMIEIHSKVFPATCLDLYYRWQPDTRYQIIILPGGLNDYYGFINDSIVKTLRVNDPEQFGNINVSLEDLNNTHSYLVQLMERDRIVESSWIDRKSNDFVSFQHLRPGTFTLVVIHDKNRNKRWDPVDYLRKKEPEPVLRQDLERLRANWDVEVTVKWKLNL